MAAPAASARPIPLPLPKRTLYVAWRRERAEADERPKWGPSVHRIGPETPGRLHPHRPGEPLPPRRVPDESKRLPDWFDDGGLWIESDEYCGSAGLLVELVRKEQADVMRVPLAHILTAFVERVESRAFHLDDLSDFAALAARLMHMKARLLLPLGRPLLEPVEPEGADPRPEIVTRLLRLQSYRDAAERFDRMPTLGRNTFEPGDGPADELTPPPGTAPAGIDDLLRAFEAVVARAAVRLVQHTVKLDEVPVEAAVARIADHLRSAGRVSFAALCEGARTKGELIAALLAVLELARLKVLGLMQAEGGGDIILVARVPAERLHDLLDGFATGAVAAAFDGGSI